MRSSFPKSTLLGLGLLLSISAGTAVLSTTAVNAAETESLNLSYSIYVGRNRVYRINYSALLSDSSYKTAVAMSPKGLGKLFVDFRLSMATAGRFASGLPQPVDFTMESSKEDEHKKVSITWSPSDLPKVDRSFRMNKKQAAAVDRVVNPEMPDPLTAILHHALRRGAKPCTRNLRSYNGAEVYDLAFTYLGGDEIQPAKHSIYSGSAIKCRVVFVPVAGFSDKKMKKHLSNPPTYIVWFAEFTSPRTSTELLVPVLATGKVAGRSFKIVASEADMSGQPLAALSQFSD
jgi:hypothetical protein